MRTRAILLYPEIKDSFWGYKYALPYIGKKALLPPLGLLTIASLFPDRYDLKLYDLNIAEFDPRCLAHADIIFISVAAAQKDSFEEIMEQCRASGKPVVVGGPYPTSFYEEGNTDLLFSTVTGADHYIVGEAEDVFPVFLDDFEHGRAQRIYCGSKIDLGKSPVPRYELIRADDYAGMGVQFSRGCPYNCEFCEITYLFGKNVRTKSSVQFIAELDAILKTGYRGPVFIVDDNFIMRRTRVKELLAEMAKWQRIHHHPFTFTVQASIDMSQDDELLTMCVDAGLKTVFIGIETPHRESLQEIKKTQNARVNLRDSIRKIQSCGIEVTGGFIVGFDHDPEDIFARQIEFIQDTGIVKAMVGLLQLSPNTALYKRLEQENRILTDVIPTNNTHLKDLNYIPVIPRESLISGYYSILREIYTPKNYFIRCLHLFRSLSQSRAPVRYSAKVNPFKAAVIFFRVLFMQAFSSYGADYLIFLLKILRHDYRYLPKAFVYAGLGHHFFMMTEDILNSGRIGTAESETTEKEY